MSKNEAETRYELIDPILRVKGYRIPYIKLETPAPVEPNRDSRDTKTGASLSNARCGVIGWHSSSYRWSWQLRNSLGKRN
jgi:hypothetical protein